MCRDTPINFYTHADTRTHTRHTTKHPGTTRLTTHSTQLPYNVHTASVQCPTPEAVPLQSHQSKETSCSLRLRGEGLLSSLAHILQVRRDGGGERDRVTDTLPCIVLYSQKASSHSWMSYFNVTRMAPSQQLYTGRPPTWTGT